MRLTLCAVESSPAGAAPALPIIGAALGSVVTVTRVEAIRAPVSRWTGCRGGGETQSSFASHTHAAIPPLTPHVHIPLPLQNQPAHNL